MQILAEEIEGSFYLDIVLDPEDQAKLIRNEMLSSDTSIRYRKYFIGIRLKGEWDYVEEDDDREEEDF